jgi:hypothetical protein
MNALLEASDGAVQPAVPPKVEGETTDARVVAARLRLLVGSERAPSWLRRRDVVSEKAYQADGRELRVHTADRIRDGAGLAELAARLAGASVARVGDATVSGHAAGRYRAADGREVVVWGCPSRRASFVALGDAAVLARVTCH